MRVYYSVSAPTVANGPMSNPRTTVFAIRDAAVAEAAHDARYDHLEAHGGQGLG